MHPLIHLCEEEIKKAESSAGKLAAEIAARGYRARHPDGRTLAEWAVVSEKRLADARECLRIAQIAVKRLPRKKLPPGKPPKLLPCQRCGKILNATARRWACPAHENPEGPQ